MPMAETCRLRLHGAPQESFQNERLYCELRIGIENVMLMHERTIKRPWLTLAGFVRGRGEPDHFCISFNWIKTQDPRCFSFRVTQRRKARCMSCIVEWGEDSCEIISRMWGTEFQAYNEANSIPILRVEVNESITDCVFVSLRLN